MDPPIKLVTPTMQVTEQAKDSINNPSDFAQLSKQKRSYRKSNTRKKGKNKPIGKRKSTQKKTTDGKYKKKSYK
jgi:hypothetical protein